MAWMRKKLLVPKGFGPKQREELGQDVIEEIRARSKAGLDRRNNQFRPYSPSYRKAKRRLGGSTSVVNLTLSGQMLRDLKLISHRSGQIIVGYEKGTKSNSKAEGNIKGTYGGKVKRKKPRDFLGVPREDYTELKRRVKERSE